MPNRVNRYYVPDDRMPSEAEEARRVQAERMTEERLIEIATRGYRESQAATSLPLYWEPMRTDLPSSQSAYAAELERITRTMWHAEVPTVRFDEARYTLDFSPTHDWNVAPERSPHFEAGDSVIIKHRGTTMCGKVQSWAVNGLGHVVYRVAASRYNRDRRLDMYSVAATEVVGGSCRACATPYDLLHTDDGLTFCIECEAKQRRALVNV